MKTQRRCRMRNCQEPPKLGGLCQMHYDEHIQKQQLEEDSVRLLHQSVVDDISISEPALKEELVRIQKWWNRTCDTLIFQREDPVLRDEAEYATSWCIAIARGIIIAERAHRKGAHSLYDLEAARAWVWDRFNNLEKGLMSNGIPYPKR